MTGLLTGYQQAAPGSLDRERLATHTAARLLRLAVEPFRKREPDWANRVAALLQRAETIGHEIPVNF